MPSCRAVLPQLIINKTFPILVKTPVALGPALLREGAGGDGRRGQAEYNPNDRRERKQGRAAQATGEQEGGEDRSEGGQEDGD